MTRRWMRNPSVCEVDECSAKAVKRGMCNVHYCRAARHGDATVQLRRRTGTALERVMPRLDQSTGCWIWQGTVARNGYGRITIHNRARPVHRVVYEALVGPVPTGMELDHLCEVKTCANPDHLEAVTHEENMRRRRRSEREKSNARYHALYEHLRDWHGVHPDALRRAVTERDLRALHDDVAPGCGVRCG